jgi:plastocyanin
MKKILLLSFAFLSVQLVAQTTHNVTASGMSFSPNSLTIEIGDSVVFTNTGGSHNVNGTQVSFPANPESFGNTIGPAGWVYGFKFTVEGTYSYKCDVHGVGMSGTITVVDPAGIEEKPELSYSIYPNPANAILNVNIDPKSLSDNMSIVLYDLTGKQVTRIENVRNQVTALSLDNLVTGIYFCSIYDGGELLVTEKVVRY